jgi:small nuclear ribonucleoprotein (snRNP)-like protein
MQGKRKLLGKLIGYDDFMNITLDEAHEFTQD